MQWCPKRSRSSRIQRNARRTTDTAVTPIAGMVRQRQAPLVPFPDLATHGCAQAWVARSIPRTCSTCSLGVAWEAVRLCANPGGFGSSASFSFGGPGVRTQYYRPSANRGRPAQGAQQGANTQTSTWFQLLPILILLGLSALSYLPSLFTVSDPDFRWRPTTVHRAHRTTYQRGVSYYVDPVTFARHPFVTSTTGSSRGGGTLHRFSKSKSSPELLSFEKRVEDSWMKELYRQCENAHEYKRRRLIDAQGFFGFGGDQEKIAKIQAEVYESCEQLEKLFHIRL